MGNDIASDPFYIVSKSHTMRNCNSLNKRRRRGLQGSRTSH